MYRFCGDIIYTVIKIQRIYIIGIFVAQVHGIEADVVLKNEGTDKQELLPIMAHPPNFQSDLTLRSFLHETILSRSAIKLDFKSMSSVELSLQMLHQLKGQVKFLSICKGHSLHHDLNSQSSISSWLRSLLTNNNSVLTC